MVTPSVTSVMKMSMGILWPTILTTVPASLTPSMRAVYNLIPMVMMKEMHVT